MQFLFFIFFKGWWHLVAFIFTCSYFLRGFRGVGGGVDDMLGWHRDGAYVKLGFR